jgi:hypothetical protein
MGSRCEVRCGFGFGFGFGFGYARAAAMTALFPRHGCRDSDPNDKIR